MNKTFKKMLSLVIALAMVMGGMIQLIQRHTLLQLLRMKKIKAHILMVHTRFSRVLLRKTALFPTLNGVLVLLMLARLNLVMLLHMPRPLRRLMLQLRQQNLQGILQVLKKQDLTRLKALKEVTI